MSSRFKRPKPMINPDFLPNMTPTSSTTMAKKYLIEIENIPGMNVLNFPNDPTTYDFKMNDFQEVETLGTGNYTVKKFIHKPTNRAVAIKSIHVPYNRCNTEKDLKKLKHLAAEITHFKDLTLKGIPNVLKSYGFGKSEGQILLCMEVMDMSLNELYKTIHSKGLYFPEDVIGCITADILDALIACKSNNLIHRDIKPPNVLINKNGEVKVADFGETRILHDSLASSLAGTIRYRPPEHFDPELSKTCDVRTDIWSLGIVLIELILGRVPYKYAHGGDKKFNIILLQNEILQTEGKELAQRTFEAKHYSPELQKFVKICLRPIKNDQDPTMVRPKYPGLQTTRFYQKYCELGDEERKKIIGDWLRDTNPPEKYIGSWIKLQ